MKKTLLYLITCVILILFGCGDKNIKNDLEFVTNSSFFQKNEKYPKIIKEILNPYSISNTDSFLRFDPITFSILNTKNVEVKFDEILFKYMKGTSGNPEKIKLYTKKLNEFFDKMTIEKQYTSVYDSSFNYNDAVTKYYNKHSKSKCIIFYSDSVNSEDSVYFLNQLVYGNDDFQLIRSIILDSILEYPTKKIAIIINPTLKSKTKALNQEVLKSRFADTSANITTNDSSTFVININGSTDYIVDGKVIKISRDTIFKDGTYTFDIRIKNTTSLNSSAFTPNSQRRKSSRFKKAQEKKRPIAQPPINKLSPLNSIRKN